MEKGRKVDLRIDMWMYEAIEKERKERGLNFSDLVNKLLRQELEYLHYTEGKFDAQTYKIGKDRPIHVLQTKEPEPSYGKKIIDISQYTHDDMPPMDTVKFMGWEMVILPYVGKTAAGEPINIDAYTGEGMPFPLPLLNGKPENYYIVKIEGSSMTEADIYNGDYVLIRKAEEPINGKIMLVRYENSSTLKRIKIEAKEDRKTGSKTETVFLLWENGSGDFKQVDSEEYQIQGEFYRNLGK